MKLWKGDGGLEREMGPLADIGTRVAVTSDAARIFAGDWGGDLIAFLAGPRSAYITGQNIRIDGGITRSV